MRLSFIIIVISLQLASCENPGSSDNSDTANADTMVNHWNVLISKYPDSLILKENLLQHFRDQNQLNQAINSVNAYLKNDSLNARLWSIKAVLHYENEDTTSSINAFEKAISITPNLTDLESLGSLYAGITHPRTTEITQIMRNIYAEKSEKEALFIEGTYLKGLLEYAKAIKLFDQCIELEFSFMEAYREKAQCQMALYQYKAARITMERAVQLQNNYLDGWFLLGQICEELLDKTAAEAAYRRILLYDAQHEEAKERLKALGIS